MWDTQCVLGVSVAVSTRCTNVTWVIDDIVDSDVPTTLILLSGPCSSTPSTQLTRLRGFLLLMDIGNIVFC